MSGRKRLLPLHYGSVLRDDTGMSLVELIVGVVVSGLVLSVIAILFGNGLVSIQKTAERDLATGKANSASLFLTESMRDATGAYINGLGSPGVDGIQNIYLSVQLSDGSYECRYWLWNYGWTNADEQASGVEKGNRLQYRSYADRRVNTDAFEPLRLLASWENEGAAEFPVLVDGQPSFSPSAGVDSVQAKRMTLNIGATEGETTVRVTSGTNALVVDGALSGEEAALVCGI